MNNLTGKILGNRYLLMDKIGEGGMAIVYKAKCQLLNRFVAIKILKPEYINDEDFVKKFKRESLAAASLSHPNIVSIYDVGEEDDIYYIVMEYVNGQTLKDYIKSKGKINYIETLKIVQQIAMALDNAHKNGIVHRDIKPHNILLTDDGIAKVTDFGIARASSTTTVTNYGNIMGSVHYFSPEQARGGFTDHRTDIYSLGVVMYEMLTGKLPFDAESPVSIALKHIQEDFVEPMVINPNIPKAVNDIVKKCMKKDVTQRYQNAKELMEDISVAMVNPMQPIKNNLNESDETKVIPVDEIDDALKKPDRKKKKYIIPAIISAVVVIALIIVAFISFKIFSPVKDAKVPQVMNLTIQDAQNKIKDAKLQYQMLKAQNSDKPEGTIISVDPGEGTTVKEGSTVKLTASAGAEKVSVPDISKLDKDSASAALQKNGLQLGDVSSKNSDDVAKDIVISQSPEQGTQVAKNSKVDIVISSGPEVKFVVVPALSGKTLDDAKKLIQDSKLTLGNVSSTTVQTTKDGIIVNQDIAAGTQVKEGTTINITVNKNPNGVTP